MLDFIIYYPASGLILSILINLVLWAFYKPQLSSIQVIACILMWPTVVCTMINTLNGIEEDN